MYEIGIVLKCACIMLASQDVITVLETIYQSNHSIVSLSVQCVRTACV